MTKKLISKYLARETKAGKLLDTREIRSPSIILATFFYIGFLRPAPGTWASLMATLLAVLIFITTGWLILGLVFILCLFPGIRLIERAENIFGVHDNKAIVLDEVAGQLIALAPVFYFFGAAPLMCFMAFILFRFFDILKPWPVSWAEKNIPGAWGVMVDDLIAGALGALILTGAGLWMTWSGV